jgi:hypothetical protein
VSRRTRIAVVVVVAAAIVAAAVLLIWRPWETAPAIQTEALGVWQEQTAADPIRMTVSADDPAGDGTPQYWVDLPVSFKVPFPARLEGDSIVVWGENTQDIVWRITYDEGADVLLLTRPDGSERHILRRVSS